jgi:hypothetical protein
MTELAEPIAIGVVSEINIECPLDHSITKIESENEFVGDGGVLGNNMQSGVSTITYPPNQRGKVAENKYPEQDPWVEVDGNDYPVTCAAHHLIPAQASLKRAEPLHQWMVYLNKSQPMKGGTATGKVWADVGYDVNGVENGVWLPGNYAVGGGSGGTREWESAPSALDNELNGVPPPPQPKPKKSTDTTLTGLRHNYDTNNRKGQYVIEVTRLYRAQFHDSHNEYSDFVTNILMKLASLYEEQNKTIETSCPKCKERFDKIKNEGTPTHFGLAHRLNGVSSKLRGYLTGNRGHSEVYTSMRGKAACDQGKDKL